MYFYVKKSKKSSTYLSSECNDDFLRLKKISKTVLPESKSLLKSQRHFSIPKKILSSYKFTFLPSLFAP